MRSPSLQRSPNAPDVGIDRTDWDCMTALQVAVEGGRAERRAAHRWLRKHKQQFLVLLKSKQQQEKKYER